MIAETRIRKIYRPLNTAISVKVDGISVAQVVNQFAGTISPKRNNSDGERTILTPIVIAQTGANDPTWTDGNYAKNLIDVAWFANGVNISVEGTDIYNAFHDGNPLFDIITDSGDDTQGSLRLWKNLKAEEHYAMHMEAKLYDSRTKHNYIIKTDPIELSATALGEDEWDFSIVHDVNIQYNPLFDRLKLYDWKVEKKLITASDTEKAKYIDAASYDLKLPIFITKGHYRYTPDNHILFEIGEQTVEDGEVKYRAIATVNYDGTLTRINETLDSWLTEFTKTYIRVDRRKMPCRTMVLSVKMMVKDKNNTLGFVQSQEQLTFTQIIPRVEVHLSNNSDIDLTATNRWEKAVASYNGKRIEYPEAYLRMSWTARASLSEGIIHIGYGEEISIDQKALGIEVGGKDRLYLYQSCALLTGLDFKNNDDSVCIKDASSSKVFEVGSISSINKKTYKPLSISTIVEASGMPLIQTDGDESTQRSEDNPLILTPIINAFSSVDDSTWTDGNSNQYLNTDATWLVNGEDISKDFSGQYSIDTSETSSRGTLKLWHNCIGNEQHTLQFSAILTDPRNGQKYHILTDAVDIMSQTPAEAEWDFSVVHDVNIRYSPIIDRLRLYDWLVSQGETPIKEDYQDATGYELTLPLLITHGHNKATSTDNITFKLFDHSSNTEITPDTDPLITSISNSQIQLDLRFLSEEQRVIDVRMFVDGNFDQYQSQEQLTISTYYPSIVVSTTNKADIDLTADTRWDKAVVMINGNQCKYPEAYLTLSWFAKANEEDEWVSEGTGENILIDQTALNLTNDLFVKLEYSIKPSIYLLSTEDGKFITNSSGQYIIVEY